MQGKGFELYFTGEKNMFSPVEQKFMISNYFFKKLYVSGQ